MSLPVRPLVEAEGLLPSGGVGDDGLGAAILQPPAKLGAVVRFVPEQPLGRFGATDEPRGRRAVVGLTAGQQEGKKTAFSICDCMDFRVAPAARAANRLFLLPPFPPEAER